MRKPPTLIIILLLASTITIPIIDALDIPRHLDPATLPEENPGENKLFNLYYNIFHETATENFTGASLWLDWASKVDALPNLKPQLQTYYNTTKAELSLISEISSFIVDIKIKLKRLDPETLTEIKQTQTILNNATITLNDINSQSQTLGTALQYPTTQLDYGVVELGQLLATYNTQLKLYEQELTTDFNATKPTLHIYANKAEATPGEVLLIQGSLTTANETALPNRPITVYFEDTPITSTNTTELGGIKTEFTIPFLYQDNATIYAEYNPEGADAARYGRTISNIITLKINWVQPTLTIQVPEKAYPGTELRITGLLSDMRVGLIGLNITVTALGETMTDETSRKGTFTTVTIVPENFPEGTQQVIVKFQAAGVFGNTTTKGQVLITRYPSKITVDSPSWIISGQKLRVTGKVESQNHTTQDTLIELRSPAGKNTVNANSDGSFKTEIELPMTLLTSTYTYQVFSRPDPWIREASATGSVLVINPLTLLLVLGIVGVVTIQVSKRIHTTPKSREKVKPETKISETLKPTEEPAKAAENQPDNPRDLFWWTATRILSRFNVALGKNMTIREWLNSLKEKTDTPLYTLIERIGLQYEKSLYGKPHRDEQETKTLFQKIREHLT